MKVSTQGLGGGVRSHIRTRLDRKFPIIGEFSREFRLFASSADDWSDEISRLARISHAVWSRAAAD
jgi:hypothetical protein